MKDFVRKYYWLKEKALHSGLKVLKLEPNDFVTIRNCSPVDPCVLLKSGSDIGK